MRILHLTLYRKWFDLITTGRKSIEYREDSQHWHNRIFNNDGTVKKLDEIHFRNGYGSCKPLMVTEFLGVVITHTDLCKGGNGEVLAGRIILMFIGRRIRFENYQIDQVRRCAGCNKAIPYQTSLYSECEEQLNQGRMGWGDDMPSMVFSSLPHSDHNQGG